VVKKPTKSQLNHWEKILRREGLDMGVGLNPQYERYVGSIKDLEQIEEITSSNIECGGGKRVRPKGRGDR